MKYYQVITSAGPYSRSASNTLSLLAGQNERHEKEGKRIFTFYWVLLFEIPR